MELIPSAEQESIIDQTAAFLAKRLPLRRLHKEPRLSAAIGREIAELGWLGMAIPEEAGGVGYSVAEEVLVFRELGRVVGPLGVLTAAVGAKAAVAGGNDALAQRIVAGEAGVALALRNDLSLPPDTLKSRRLYEVEGAALALLCDGDRVRLLDLSGRNFELRPCLDKSISQAVRDLEDCPVLVDVQTPAVRVAGALLSAAMMQGTAEAARDMIVEYAKVRTTFGRPIGAYQAVRHPCAEMAVRCEAARCQLLYAALAVAEGHDDAAVQVSCAKVIATNAVVKNADDCIQLHGGIGVTDEYDSHFLMKRATVMKDWFDGNRLHLERILDVPVKAV